MSELYWPENLLIWGAGATSLLGIPTTAAQEQFLTTLFKKVEDDLIENQVKEAFNIQGQDLQEVVNIIQFFRSEEEKEFKGISPHLKNDYDWHTLEKIVTCCPKRQGTISLVDLYGILDLYLSENRGFSLMGEPISYHQLLNAKQMLILLIQLFFYWKYQWMLKEKQDTLKKYYEFYKVLAVEMLASGDNSFNDSKINDRNYYLFNYSIVSLNWDPILLWLIFNVHKDLNDENSFYVDSQPRKLKLFNDFATFLGTRSVDEELNIWYPFNEAVVQRINDPHALTDKRVRIGKFYFPHGSSAWRECPHCGKLMMYMGEEWGYTSSSLMAPLPFQYFSDHFKRKTQKEKNWFNNQEYDAIECVFCGNKTKFKDTTMLIQSAFKGRNTSFIEEIQRDMRIAFEKSNHIIFLGYSLPSDDISYRSMLSSRCQQKNKKGDKLRVTVVLYDSESERKWYEGDDLQSYLVERSNTEAAQSIVRIKEVLGEDTPIRAYLQGIPDVFLDCNENVSKENVLNLINWN